MVSHRVEVNGGRFSPHIPTIAVNRWDEPDHPQCLTATANGPIHAKGREQSPAPRTSSASAASVSNAPGAKRLRPDDDIAMLYGWHTVKAALENPARRVRKLLATENAARRLAEENVALAMAPEIVRPGAIAERLSPDAVHQGLYLEADPLPSPPIEEIAPQGVVLVLDQITDPHNVGAIFRSAAAFAATAIVTTARHSPGGHRRAGQVRLRRARARAADHGAEPRRAAWRRSRSAASSWSGSTPAATAISPALPLRKPLALVLGAEGRGLRQLTKETCDHVARLDLPGAIKSLNVSNAAALALYIAQR